MAKYTLGVYGDLIYGRTEQVKSIMNIVIELPVNPSNNVTMDPNYGKKMELIYTALKKASSLVVTGKTLPLIAGNLAVKYGQAGKEESASFTVNSSQDFNKIKTFITDHAPRSSVKGSLKAKL